MGVLRNEVPKWITVGIWVAIQLALFGYFFYFYYTHPQFEYTRRILRLGLVFARAPSNCLNFNCMLILLPVCRNLLSFTRRYIFKCCFRSIRRLLDENISFHKLCAYAICFWTAVHTIAHCYNAEFFTTARTVATTSPNVTGVTVQQLSTLSCPPTYFNDSWLNPVCELDSHTVIEAVKIFPALSGIIITLALIFIVLSATEFIRRSYFEIFWFTHHLFIIFFAFLVAHGFRGVVRAQDFEVHDPQYCGTIAFSQWGKDPRCPFPTFRSSVPSTWMWVLGPMVLYAIERLIRFIRSFQTVVITKVQ